MPVLAELEATAERAEKGLRDALARAEHAPLTKAIEEYARARALLFAQILIEQLKHNLAATPPSTTGEVIALLDATLEAAAAAYAERVASGK